MAYIRINGSHKLNGEVRVQGSKNSVLPIIAGSILHKGTTVIENCPEISDVDSMIDILKHMGADVKREKERLIIDAVNVNKVIIPEEYTSKLRASIILAGAVIGRFGETVIASPGGCNIGKRPVDWHIEAFKKLGVRVIEEENYIYCKAKKSRNAILKLNYPSVGVTENVILLSVLSDKCVNVYNYAKEPEIIDLCKFLNGMGANIKIEKNRLIIKGVDKLHDSSFKVCSDRIVAGTYITAVAGVGGQIFLKDINIEDNKKLISILRKMGVEFKKYSNGLFVKADKLVNNGTKIITGPFPMFPTDMQPQMMSVLSGVEGVSEIYENVFDSRFNTAFELQKMGADINIFGNLARINGVNNLSGECVNATDLRSGAALVVAGLIANGVTEIYEIDYIKRGYEDICRDIRLLGGDAAEMQL